MASIHVTDSGGKTAQLELTSGSNLMEVLREADFDEVQALCGGCCSCATCHVHIPPQSGIELSPLEEDEQELLTLADNYQEGQSRLSCQIKLTDAHDGLQVVLIEQD